MKKRKPDTVAPKPLSPAEAVSYDALQVAKDYLQTVKNILGDYAVDLMLGDGIITELDAAGETLVRELSEIDTTQDDDQVFKYIVEQVGELNLDSWQTQELLSKLDEEEVNEFVRGKGFMAIKIDNMDKQSKLEEFIETEIFPLYNDQVANSIF